MRAAYYLAPRNTYWHRRGPELPDPTYLKENDYILIVQPSNLQLSREQQLLRYPGGAELSVEILSNNPQSSLARVRQGTGAPGA